MIMNNLNIMHDASKHIFYARVKGGIAELNYERHGDKYLDYKSTYVPRDSRGYGVASTMVLHALRFAMGGGLEVKPSCPFVESVIQKNPEFHHILYEGAQP